MGLREQARTEDVMDQTSSDQALLARQIKDYCQVGIDLIWQRQIIFGAALALAAFYYDVWLALGVLVFVLTSEIYDCWVFKRALNWNGKDRSTEKRFMWQIYIGTILSASVISGYAIGIAVLQGHTTHFMPLFFLFAAALFAAMNNHQLKSVLTIRLLIYGATFLYIPIRDIVLTDAPLKSELWAQLFTSLFVLFFIIDSSRHYLQLYRTQVAQMRQLRVEHENSQMAYRAKTEFVSTMSHELRTPLTSIKGSVDLVNSGILGELPDQVSKTLKVAQRNCTRLLTLINEILDLQSVESGRVTFETETLDLGETIEQSVSDNEPFASRLNVQVDFTAPAGSVWVNSDRARLQQVFSNILSNAAKFSPADSTVDVRTEVGQSHVDILFSDKGIGLSEEDYDKVFDRFTQIDSSDTRQIGGTGLGMNISKRIMEALGGSISYRKNPDRGTTFIVRLPLSEV
ncbi:HAMP domain-containing sensor histidine kinase [uncultured Shimia sp.]|uniref:sensor histidine kinase n=2 Tax=Shimia TaxID=573139 RepID=UPI002613E8C2|nr:HAMP domain-containing sensor histidine kinase [uncultured Shimia sp.]